MIVPDAQHHDFLNDAIYEELVHGVVLPRTRSRVVSIIEELWDAGAGGVLLGCTELELLVKQADVELPVFPCTTLHVQAALDARARLGRCSGRAARERSRASAARSTPGPQVGGACLRRQRHPQHLRPRALGADEQVGARPA